MLSKVAWAVGVAVLAALAVLALNLYRAGQGLARAFDSSRIAAPVPGAASLAGRNDSELDAALDGDATAARDSLPTWDVDWPDSGETFESDAADERQDALTSIQELLNDPDPEVRSEAAALLQVWQGESTPAPADLSPLDP